MNKYGIVNKYFEGWIDGLKHIYENNSVEIGDEIDYDDILHCWIKTVCGNNCNECQGTSGCFYTICDGCKSHKPIRYTFWRYQEFAGTLCQDCFTDFKSENHARRSV